MKNYLIACIILMSAPACELAAQQKKAGGPCEGFEAIYESPVPFEKIKSFVELPDVSWDGKKEHSGLSCGKITR
ncbi:hypothetical protein [Pedobacter ginsengisoli]|uniref:hypothetical protein n=1 Tax=Pedobacter ginsengisoli TaxID=363852 RepID=UPI00254DB7E3|nr:hypothetical protein [Pedobacter ginsengisoli]